MIVTIHQPEHLPWLGFFHKMHHADCMVVLDNVQYRKNYFQNRNKILTKNGAEYVTVPVSEHQGESRLIKDLCISGCFRRNKYLKTLYFAYKDHPYFDLYFNQLEKIVQQEHTLLAQLNMDIIRFFMDSLHIETKLYLASEMNAGGSKSELLLNLCKKLHADVYLSGPSGRDYLDEKSFNNEAIQVIYHDFPHPSYPQRNSDSFQSHLSTIDLLFNCGEKSRNYLINHSL